jgi:hypothetical protein
MTTTSTATIVGKDFDGKTLVRLSAELIATLTPTGDNSCIQFANGEYRRANGFSGTIAGGQSSYWITPEGDTADLNRTQIERLCN